MPRHVVTLTPRLLVLPSRKNRERRAMIVERLGESYRLERHRDGRSVQIHFPKQKSRREAKNEVASRLGAIAPRWHRLFVLYPSEFSLRDRGE